MKSSASDQSTGSPSSKYEHGRAWALLRNIQNIRICMGKKPIVSVTYENERISLKNSLSYYHGKMSQKIYSNLFSNFVSKIRQSYVIVTKCSHLFHERNKGHYKTQSSRGFLTGCVESLNLPSFYYLCILIYLSQKTPNFLECNLSD